MTHLVHSASGHLVHNVTNGHIVHQLPVVPVPISCPGTPPLVTVYWLNATIGGKFVTFALPRFSGCVWRAIISLEQYFIALTPGVRWTMTLDNTRAGVVYSAVFGKASGGTPVGSYDVISQSGLFIENVFVTEGVSFPTPIRFRVSGGGGSFASFNGVNAGVNRQFPFEPRFSWRATNRTKFWFLTFDPTYNTNRWRAFIFVRRIPACSIELHKPNSILADGPLGTFTTLLSCDDGSCPGSCVASSGIKFDLTLT